MNKLICEGSNSFDDSDITCSGWQQFDSMGSRLNVMNQWVNQWVLFKECFWS